MPKKVLMIIAPDKFRDEEYFDTKEELEAAGFEVVTANSNGQPSKSSFGKIVTPDSNFYTVKSEDYDAIVFVGGGGTAVYFDNLRALELAREFNSSGKIVSAICIAPVILANSGILNGKNATAFHSARNEINAVAIFTGADVEVDGKIVTANGPKASRKFGKTVARMLKEE